MRSTACSHRNSWAVLLAGGDGTRLQSLTQTIAGDLRPKQFCELFGGKTLLTQTQERVASLFCPSRTLCVFTQSHEHYFRKLDVDAAATLVQPENRGTAIAICTALLHISRQEPDALVSLFPCDHFYANNEAFAEMVRFAGAYAGKRPKMVVILGAQAHYPETEYGWIDPGRQIPGNGVPLLSVNKFWEKPDLSTAQTLLNRGCMWNTFVTIGYARTLLQLMSSQSPYTTSRLAGAVSANELKAAYREVRSVDFSRDVLTHLPHRLLVVRDVASGWTDLGTPARVADALVKNAIETVWLGEFQTLQKRIAS
jgi:mannose-1-phosphate guanylyltransferase